MKHVLIAAAAGLCAAFAAPAQHRLYDNEFPLSQVRLLPGSDFRHAADLNTQVLLAYDTDRLLAPYLKEAGLPPKAESFSNWDGLDGHIGGHYLSALAIGYASTAHPELKRRMDYMVDELARCAQASGCGYCGGVPGSRELWDAVRAGDVKAVWDRWVPWYNVHKTFAGLRDAWLYGGNESARDLFLGMCDWAADLTAALSDEQMEHMLDNEHGGMPEVLADAYAITSEKRYLDAARRFCHHRLLDAMAAGIDNLDNMHANTQVPKVVGFQRIGELGADGECAAAARFFWHTVTENRSLCIGGNSRREHFPAADDYMSYVTDREGPESCNTNNMLKLTEGLFREAPSAALADYYERALYNHILSTQHPAHGGYVYFTPARPGHYRVYSQPNSAMWCCVGTGMENHGKYGQFIYTHEGADTLRVNLFIPSELDWKERGVRVAQHTSFPHGQSTRLTVGLDRPSSFTLMVRRPAWIPAGAEMSVAVNGKPVRAHVDSSGYAVVARRWRDGDVVEIGLPMDFSLERLNNEPQYVSILRGPIVLGARLDSERLDGLVADDSRWAHIAHGPLRSVFETPVILADSAALLSAIRPDESCPGHYTLEGVFADPDRKVVLQPFSTIHDARYMLYWLTMSPAQFEARRERMLRDEQALLALDARTVDAVRAGEQQPEADHFMVADRTEAAVFFGQPCRRGWGGSFSYRMRTLRTPDLRLMVRYWGNETGSHKFDVLADGEVITTESIGDRWRDERFVDVVYELPQRVSEADSVEIAFRAHEGCHVGDIFHVRLVKPE
ncbi:MAG: glycoside hydrolase family 127 protein [Muribaculaceae bacterium]|nr:glycoside hydrolase family 127 protein [Muribaculaceae bacterium]